MDAGKEGIDKDNGDEKEGETVSLEEAQEMLMLSTVRCSISRGVQTKGRAGPRSWPRGC